MRVLVLIISGLFLVSCNSGGGGYGAGDTSRGVSVCGSSDIKGKRIPRVRSSSNPACGFGDAVEVYSVSGVAVRGNPKMRCETARSLNQWTSRSAIPSVRRATGETLESMTIWVGYACRSRSSSNRLSEHALGNAVDISAFTTDEGNAFTVLKDWGRGAYGRALKAMKAGACGPFGVVLHPGNDRYHKDHFHFDLSNRNGRWSYCKRNP